MPKIRIESRRKIRYDRSVAVCQLKNPDLTLADWVRWACDQQANLDLNKHRRDSTQSEE